MKEIRSVYNEKIEAHMKSNFFLFVLTILTVFVTAEVKSQSHPQPFPNPQVINPPDDWLLKIFLNNKFRIGGVESSASTYGYFIGGPVLWAADQLKIVPVMGRYWRAPEAWAGQSSIGGRVLYYLNKQASLVKGDMNPYIGGFSLTEGEVIHHSGIAIGVEPSISKYFKLGFEFQAGLRSENGEDRGFGGAAISIGFGW